MNLFQRVLAAIAFPNVEQRASVQRGGSLSAPPSWLEKSLIGGSDDEIAGVEITPNSALSISTYFACILVISEDVAKLPISIIRNLTDGKKERLNQHPVYRLLNVEPNPEMTPISFRAAIMSHILGWGNGYAEIVRLGNGRPAELWPMKPDRTAPLRLADGSIAYDYTRDNGNRVRLPAENVLHIPGLGFDGIMGYSPVSLARQSLALSAAAEKYGASFFGNSSMPKGILEHPGKLGKQAGKNLRESWESNYRGPANANKVGILEEGMKFHAISVPPEDAQFLETRQFQVTEMCRWFRMAPHKIGDLSNAHFSNIEHSAIEHVTGCLHPWFVRWEQEIARKLFMGSERDLYAAHNTAALLRGDLKSRYEAYAIGRQWGWHSVNDVLRKEDENPIEEGDVYLVPDNMSNAKAIVKQTEPKGTGQSPGLQKVEPAKQNQQRSIDVEKFRESVFSIVSKVRRSQAEKIERHSKRSDFASWSLSFVAAQRGEFSKNVGPTIRGICAAGGLDGDVVMNTLSAYHAAGLAELFTRDVQSDVQTSVLAWSEGTKNEVDTAIDLISRTLREESGSNKNVNDDGSKT